MRFCSPRRPQCGSHAVHRTPHSETALFEHVHVDHCRAQVFVFHQLVDRRNVAPTPAGASRKKAGMCGRLTIKTCRPDTSAYFLKMGPESYSSPLPPTNCTFPRPFRGLLRACCSTASLTSRSSETDFLMAMVTPMSAVSMPTHTLARRVHVSDSESDVNGDG